MRAKRFELACVVASSARRALACVRGVTWSVAFVCTTVAVRPVAAQAGPQMLVTLEYDVAGDAPGCPTLEEFRARVERQLKYDAFRPKADRRVAVHIARKGQGFDGWIQWSDGSGRWVGERRLSSQREECEDIAASVAFAVAVQIQLLATLGPAAGEATSSAAAGAGSSTNGSAAGTGATETGTGATAAGPSTGAAWEGPTKGPPKVADSSAPSAKKSHAGASDGEPVSPDASRAGLRLSAGLGPSLALGLAPHATAVGRIFFDARLDAFSVELGFDAAWPAKRRLTDGSGFSLSRLAAGAAVCAHVDVFAACLSAALGRIAARGFGLDKPASPSGLFSQLGARIAATHEFGGRYFVALHMDGLVMPSRWSVTLDGTRVWTTPRLGGLAGVDFGVFF